VSSIFVHFELQAIKSEVDEKRLDVYLAMRKKKQGVNFLTKHFKHTDGTWTRVERWPSNKLFDDLDTTAFNELRKLNYFQSLLVVPKSTRHTKHFKWAAKEGIITSQSANLTEMSLVEKYWLYENMYSYISKRVELGTKSKFDDFKELHAISPKKSYNSEHNLLDEIGFAQEFRLHNFKVSFNNDKNYLRIDSFPLLLPLNTESVQGKIINPVTEEEQVITYDVSAME